MQNHFNYSIKDNPLFRRWLDPVSGIESYILNRTVAPIQQSFYFTNPSITDDGRYLWFYTAFPPSGSAYSGRSLAVADLKLNSVTAFPETQFRDASPYVDTEDGCVYWCSGYAVYRRHPSPEATVELVNEIPEEIHKRRLGERLATHLSLSADRKEFFIDAHLGQEWVAGSLPINGEDFEIWETFDRCYNHAIFSPVDPNLALIAQDGWFDIVSGELTRYNNRIWTIRRGEKAKPVFDNPPHLSHEWWDPDGEHIWYVDYERGTEKVNTRTSERISVWKGGTCHSHSSEDGKYVVGDIGPYSWSKNGCRVEFFNTLTGREANLASDLPTPYLKKRSYHIHPHPQFCCNDSLICYTTTIEDRVNVALVITDDLIEATS